MPDEVLENLLKLRRILVAMPDELPVEPKPDSAEPPEPAGFGDAAGGMNSGDGA
jgi:hypothetical protein